MVDFFVHLDTQKPKCVSLRKEVRRSWFMQNLKDHELDKRGKVSEISEIIRVIAAP